jgi:hypothetical protein
MDCWRKADNGNEVEIIEVVSAIADDAVCTAYTAYIGDRSFALSGHSNGSQAARAIRTAALGMGCPMSTGGLSTESSPPAL